MTRLYRFTGVFTLLLTLLCTGVRAQTTITSQGFESADPWSFTEYPISYNISGDVWGAVSTVGGILPSEGLQFWGMQDLENENSGLDPQDTEHTLTFADITVTGFTNMELSFDYNGINFNVASEILEYEVILDGVGQGRVNLLTGQSGGISTTGWESEVIAIPDGTDDVALVLYATFNGGTQYAGFDNFVLVKDIPADPCGITSFGPVTAVCLTESTMSGTDLFQLSIPYVGVDVDAFLLVEAGATTFANDVSATTISVGDDLTSVNSGTLVLGNSAGEFEEGDQVRVTLMDGGGNCSFMVEINTTENQCSNPCDPNLNPNNIVFTCDANTAGNDMGVAIVPFTNGPEPGAIISVTPGATISGEDIATEDDGDIILSGLTEGTTYTITISGGGCTGAEEITVSVPFAAGTCVASDLVINEVNYDPFVSGGSGDLTRDPNQDGVSNGTSDEFIEFYNAGLTLLDISGFTVEDNAGVFLTFPPGTSVSSGSGFVIFPEIPVAELGCPVFGSDRTFGSNPAIGLNNDGDVVVVKNGNGAIVASFSYDASAPADQSLARDQDLTGPFVGHLSITENPVPHSVCMFNSEPNVPLPVELLSFTASASGKTVSLNWETTSEINNDHFLVQRLTANTHWTTLGNVPAMNGRSNAYEFTDETPRLGENVYRLQQLDLDGTAVVHGPVVITFATGELNVWPNPAGNEIHFGSSLTANSQITLLNANGRLLRELPVGSDRADLSDLPGGIYLLRVARASGTEVVRFVKK